MSKILFPVAAAAILLLTTSCGEDTKGTSFEVANANHDESVNPAHIRGYHTEAPGMAGAPSTPNQYYPVNTKTLPADTRQQVEGNVAVRMVTAYYSPSITLKDLAEELNPTGQMENTTNSPAGPASNNNSGNGSSNSEGSGNSTSGSGNSSGNQQQSGNGSGNTTDQQ